MVSQIHRRSFLKRLGGGAVGVGVFGIGACSPEQTSETATPTAPTTETTPPPTTTATSPQGPTEPEAELAWHRVDLDFVSAYVLRRAGRGMVVDTGVAGSEDAVERGLDTLDLAWADVDHIVLTHHHPDHVGSLGPVADRAASAILYGGEEDLSSISAPRPLIAVGDGDEVMGLAVLETPGHTPGSISVFDGDSGVLVVGDALNGGEVMGGEAGTVAGANPRFSSDMSQAEATLFKLAELEFDVVLFGHGAPVLTGASAQVAVLVAGL